MPNLLRPCWLATLAVLSLGTSLPAQRPTPAQVQTILQQPGSADAMRARIKASGLTPDQIRAGLQANGYDADLLDPFLTEGTASDSLRASTDQLAAMRALGITPATQAAQPADTGVRQIPQLPPSDVFGVDVFRRSTTQFLPLLSGPVPADYRLGPGDMLVLILTGDVELTHQLGISREGFVLIPQVGQVFLANLTLDQARTVLGDRLGRVYSGVRRGGDGTTRFELSVANVRAIQVHVIGEVTQPGAYQISALGSILTALYTAGGITELANPRTVAVRRRGETVTTFDLYRYLLSGDTGGEVQLEAGDVIFVGVRNHRVFVGGEVLRPARYDLALTETLADLIRASGGLTPQASRNRITVDRIVPAGRRVDGGPQRVTVDVPFSAADSIPPFPLENGDSVTVFPVTEMARNQVHVSGSVFLPGKFGFEPGLTLSQLIGRAGGLLPATYAGRAHIFRLNPVDQTRRLLAIALPPDSASPWPDDRILADQDSVVLYNRMEMRAERIVTITGAVNAPGQVPYRSGMTLRDLVLEGGGLASGAALDTAEIARLPVNRQPGQLALALRVPLDSTYLFDRDALGQPLGPPGADFHRPGAPEVPIAPWDHVVIFLQPGFEYQRTVTILGEVRYPGNYSLMTRNDRLIELIRRAGGMTPTAYADGLRFVRPNNNAGRLNVDYQAAVSRPASRHNLILQPGDTIIVPEFQPSVRIVGAVNSPGSVLWEEGKGLGHYVNSAGGLADRANWGRAHVTFANGSVETRSGGFLFFGGRDPKPNPGSVVTVPFKPERVERDNSTFLAAMATMIASTATIIVALLR